MKILGIDTSTDWCSLGLIDGEELLAEWTLKCKMTQLIKIMTGIKNLLYSSGLSLKDLDGIAVTTGPGSFTGIRLGLVVARTLSQVNGLKLIGVNSLEVMVFQQNPSPFLFVPVMDARRKQIYAGFYDFDGNEIRPLKEGALFYPEELAHYLNSQERTCYFTGYFLKDYKKVIMENLKTPSQWSSEFNGIIRGTAVAFLGSKKLYSGYEDNYLNLLPLYIRPPDAKVKKDAVII